MHNHTLYTIGLILVILYLAMGFDDFLWDIFSLTKRRKYIKTRFDFKALRTPPPKLLAITIGAWNEASVIEDVIENLVASIQYPKSMYHIFVGVYPNDKDTIAIISKLEKKFNNVHTVMNVLDGPTSKAQNVNNIISYIKNFENSNSLKFASITIHDAEDVVHPYELIVTNYLIDKYSALQFPVFPLMQMPKFKNFFKNLTVGTYADEFAENHFITMVGRCSTGAFVPSAGTGLTLSRKVFEFFDTDEILPNNSLTEDYRLSLTLFEKGLSMYYVLDPIPRVSNDNKIVYDYVATRSMFPSTFKKAVKQKTRWILGITMQSVKLKDILKNNKLTFIARYSVYRDLKAKIGNLLCFIGYPILIYFIVSLFIPLAPIYPKYSLSWYLSLLVTIFMIERQASRATAIANVYGFKMMFFSCLFPPILPIRIIWGNIINLVATLNAYKQNNVNIKKEKKTKTSHLTWTKTEHTFIPKNILKRYHRTFGDILIEKDIIDPDKLKIVLSKKPNNIYIGDYLLQQQIITEEQHLAVLALIKGIQYVNMGDFSNYDLLSFKDIFDKELLNELMVLPILFANNTYVIAYCEKSPLYAQTILREKYGINIISTLTTVDMVKEGLLIISNDKNSPFEKTVSFELLNDNKINCEQYIIACNYSTSTSKSIDETLEIMGLL